MSKVGNGLTASHAEDQPVGFVSNNAYWREPRVDGEPCEELEMANDAGLSGHTLLSRPQVSQFRRSMFRR